MLGYPTLLTASGTVGVLLEPGILAHEDWTEDPALPRTSEQAAPLPGPGLPSSVN